MNIFSNIYLNLEIHKDKVDQLIADYHDEDNNLRNMYSDAYYQEQSAVFVEKYRKKIEKEKKDSIATVNTYISNAQDVLISWISRPLSSDKISMLNMIRDCKIKLSQSEYEVLQASINGNYFGNRVLAEMAAKDGVRLDRINTVDVYERMIQNCISAADVFVRGYYGKNPEWIFVPDNVYQSTVVAAAAGGILKDNSVLQRAALLWDGDNIPSPRLKITADDKDILNKLYSGCKNDEEKKIRTASILGETPELMDVLRMTEYGQYIPAAQK